VRRIADKYTGHRTLVLCKLIISKDGNKTKTELKAEKTITGEWYEKNDGTEYCIKDGSGEIYTNPTEENS